MKRYFFLLFISLLLITSCGSQGDKSSASPQYAQPQPPAPPTSADTRQREEAAAQAVLDTARLAFNAGGYDAARNMVKNIRTRFPHALNAREDAILLLDSIEMHEAASRVARLDATGRATTDENIAIERAKAADKVAFYSEKLAHDQAARKQH